MPQDIEVIKTLVIGLGTTGTKVCRSVAERIEWEYGSVQRAPWVRYLCIETDSNTARGPLPDEAMVNLSIRPDEYQQVLTFAPAYDEFMDLKLWADEDTLKKIPHGEVSSGAGNIRMVGRLALLFQRNYSAVRNLIGSNLRELHLLDGVGAQTALGKMPDGTNPTITFRAGGNLRIFVTGSLCGGTCSGLVADLGYLVRKIKRPDDKVLAVLGLPRPDLSDSLEPHAERFKVNAYAALTELNHYSLPQLEKPPIKAGSEVIQTTGDSPYDVMYLAMPEATGSDAENRLTIAMADRIFLNTTTPGVDPFGKLADATIVDRNGHAHVFCTFGIRSIEFPRQRVIEGCTKQLLLYALRQWVKRDNLDQIRSQAENAAKMAGYQVQAMASALQKTDKGQEAARVLGDMVEKIAHAKSKAQAREELDRLRSVLGTGPVVATDGGLQHGDAPKWIASRVGGVVDDLTNRLHAAIAQTLLGPQGIQRSQEILVAVEEALDKAAQIKPVDTQPERQATDDALEAIQDGHWWWPPSQRRFAEARQRLVGAAREELSVTLDALSRAAITGMGPGGSHQDSVVTRCLKAVKPIRVRLDHLRQRLTYTITRLDNEVVSLTQREPTLNGEAIFSTGHWDGTIGHWYQRELGRLLGDETRWEEAQTSEAAAILSLWADLPRALRPGAEPDWLADDVDTDSPDLIPPGPWAEWLNRARQAFDKLRQRSVTAELMQLSNMRELVNRACAQTRELVVVDDALATEGGRSPIPPRTVLLRPRDGSSIDAVAKPAIQDDLETMSSPDTSRVLLLRERYRFPLYGAPHIVGESGSLAQAASGDFPTFHTRKDVYWTGLSRKEHEAQREAEEVLVVAILLEAASLEQGRIWIKLSKSKLGDPDRVELPFSVSHATRLLNPYRTGRSSFSGSGPLLRQLTDQVKRIQESEDAENFVRRLTKAFDDGIGSPLPDWKQIAGDAVRRYCMRDDKLYTAYRIVFPPSEDRIARMRRQAGASRPIGGTYKKDGLYCLDDTCCGWVGADDRDAALNGWRCFVCGRDCERD